MPLPRPARSIVARLFLAVGVPTAVVVVLLGVLSFRTTADAIERSLARELSSVATAAAATINPSMVRSVLPEEQEESRTYRRTVEKLRAIALSTGAARVTLVDGDGRLRADSDGRLRIGDPSPRLQEDRPALRAALAGDPSASAPFPVPVRAAPPTAHHPQRDDDDDHQRGKASGPDAGSKGPADEGDVQYFMSAYAAVPEAVVPVAEDLPPLPPLPDGERLVLVIEAPARALDATFAVARALTFLVVAAVLIVLLMAVVVARTITRPLLSLSAAAEELGRGRLKEPIPLAPLNDDDDEVARLARTLESMRAALMARDSERQLMLAGIAHEIRNPLGGMELFSGLLQEGLEELNDDDVGAAVKGELQQQAGRIHQEVGYLKGVVNDFLAFARDTPAHREEVVVAPFLAGIATMAPFAGLTVDVSHLADEVRFPFDPSRIKQAVLNLLENARAAVDDDTGRIVLRAMLHREHLAIAVEDNGRGMTPETRARIFTPFFTTKEKGSGLGLALVQRLARDHGGDCVVDSAVDVGTTVTITLARG